MVGATAGSTALASTSDVVALHYASIGLKTAPDVADTFGMIYHRAAFRAMPRAEWTTPEHFIALAEGRMIALERQERRERFARGY